MNAQIKIRNLVLIQPDTNVLIKGVSNQLRITGLKNIHYHITSTNSEIDTSFGVIYLRTYHDGNDTVRIISKKKILFQQVFTIQACKDATYFVAGTMDTVMTKEKLISIPQLSISYRNCLCSKRGRIASFELTIGRNQAAIFSDSSNSEYFTQQMIEKLNELKHGDFVYIENVKAISPDCRPRNLGSRRIRIR